MSDWIDLFPSPPLVERSTPLLINARDVDEFQTLVNRLGADVVTLSIADASSSVDLIDAMKRVLPFPAWCGSGWDSIDDAFAEIHAAWSFPLVLVVHGLRDLLERQPHLGLEAVIRLNGLADSFSAADDQFAPVFSAEDW